MRRVLLVVAVFAALIGWSNYHSRGSVLSFPPREQQTQSDGGPAIAPVGGGGVTVEEDPVAPASAWQPAIGINDGNQFLWRDGSGVERKFTFDVQEGSPIVVPHLQGDWSMEWIPELSSLQINFNQARAFLVVVREGGYSIGRADQGSTFRITQ